MPNPWGLLLLAIFGAVCACWGKAEPVSKLLGLLIVISVAVSAGYVFRARRKR